MILYLDSATVLSLLEVFSAAAACHLPIRAN